MQALQGIKNKINLWGLQPLSLPNSFWHYCILCHLYMDQRRRKEMLASNNSWGQSQKQCSSFLFILSIWDVCSFYKERSSTTSVLEELAWKEPLSISSPALNLDAITLKHHSWDVANQCFGWGRGRQCSGWHDLSSEAGRFMPLLH